MCPERACCRAEAGTGTGTGTGTGLTAARIRTFFERLGKRMDTYFWSTPGRGAGGFHLMFIWLSRYRVIS